MNTPKKTVSVSSPTSSELAQRYGVTTRTVGNWKAAGVNVQDSDEVKKYRATLQRSPEFSDLKEEKLAAETRLKQAQAERAELLLDQTKSNLISIPDLEENFIHIASRIKGQLSRMEKELPPTLEGLTGKEMIPIIRDKIDSILCYLSEELGTFDESPSLDVREETD